MNSCLMVQKTIMALNNPPASTKNAKQQRTTDIHEQSSNFYIFLRHTSQTTHVTSDTHHQRHTSPTTHITNDTLHQRHTSPTTHVTNDTHQHDTHHQRHTSPTTHITNGTHHQRHTTSPPTTTTVACKKKRPVTHDRIFETST